MVGNAERIFYKESYNLHNKMIIVNPGNEDYHIHSSLFSDGFNNFDEIAVTAGKIGLERIAITDHSQAHTGRYDLARKTFREIVFRWKNIHNDVEVIFGVEADILNEAGDICDDIQGVKSDFLILSAHPVYKGDPKRITEAFINAIKRHHKIIKLVGHPCAKYFDKFIDIDKVVEIANEYDIPLELNCANLVNGKTNTELLNRMLKKAKRIYVNSDAHVLAEIIEARKAGFRYLKDNGFM